jgi:hypothetical protein
MAKRKVIYKQLNIRMPDQLHKQVVGEARKNGWSVNRELVRRLEKSFADDVLKETSQFTNVWLKAIAEHIGRPDIALLIEASLQKQKEENNV